MMKRKGWLIFFLLPLQLFAQDSTMNNLMKGMEGGDNEKRPVKIFNTERTVNANTTQMVGKGKMDFRVTHNFGDIAGTNGGVKTFFGLDAITDVRIGFHIGLTDHLDLNVARDKGAGNVNQLYELAVKYKLMSQMENDPSHPFDLAIFANTVISARKALADTFPNFEYSFRSVSDRLSEVIQVILARKFGKISLQLNPTFVHTNYVILNDQNSMFALGGAVRVPVTRNFSVIVDYFHPFRSKSSKNFFKTIDNSYSYPNDIVFNPTVIKFYDPVGVSFEFTTAGHVFSLNFTNATEILENRFIPRTTSTWGKGQFRWGFTIARKFVLWKDKKK